MKALFFAVLVLIAPSAALAQASANEIAKYQTAKDSTDQARLKDGIPTSYPAAASEQVSATTIPTQAPAKREWSDIEVYLTGGILLFTLIVLGMLAYLAHKADKAWSPQSILRVFGIALIIPLAVLLIVAGYSEKQIASVVGLLGVIAGYLLGNGDRQRPGA